jgi:hypothetical protein
MSAMLVVIVRVAECLRSKTGALIGLIDAGTASRHTTAHDFRSVRESAPVRATHRPVARLPWPDGVLPNQ